MKTKGTVNLRRHLIGERKPILMFLGIGVTTLTGCDVLEEPYYVFTKIETCNKTLPGQCDAAYKEAERQALRTARKYMLESECTRDFGDNQCVEHENIWRPKIAGFITDKHPDYEFTQPLFTSRNTKSWYFNKVFSANGLVFTYDGKKLDNVDTIDGRNINLQGDLSRPLPTSEIAPPSNSVNTSMAAYVFPITPQLRKKTYDRCMQLGLDNCYTITSGTSRVNTQATNKPSAQQESGAKMSYRTTTAVKTRSYGGFGSSGRTFGGFGG